MSLHVCMLLLLHRTCSWPRGSKMAASSELASAAHVYCTIATWSFPAETTDWLAQLHTAMLLLQANEATQAAVLVLYLSDHIVLLSDLISIHPTEYSVCAIRFMISVPLRLHTL